MTWPPRSRIPRAGGFAVDMLTDGTETEIRLAVARFLSGRSPDDTVLLYLSCHAIRDRARLYFAATDTWLRYPQRSALPAAAVLGELDRCGAGNRMLILDCCFSGGFAEEKGELDVAAELALDGRGIAVLSGSRAREYSYEGRPIGPELPRSVFTEGLAVGLATGAADADGNGSVTVGEAYNYAYRYVSQNTPRQAPQYYLEDGHGEILLARTRPRTQPQAPPVRSGRPSGRSQLRRRRARAGDRRLPPGPPRRSPGPPRPRGRTPPCMPPRRRPRGHRDSRAPAAARTPQTAGGAERGRRPRADEHPAARSVAGRARAPTPRGDPRARQGQCLLRHVQPGRQPRSPRAGWGRPVRVRDAFGGRLVRELRVRPASRSTTWPSAPTGAPATGGRDGDGRVVRGSDRQEGAIAQAGRRRGPCGGVQPRRDVLLSAHEDGVARLWEYRPLAGCASCGPTARRFSARRSARTARLSPRRARMARSALEHRRR